MQGLIALAVAAGGSFSNVGGGYIVQWFGFAAGFLSLAAAALCGLVFFLMLMPETAGQAADD